MLRFRAILFVILLPPLLAAAVQIPGLTSKPPAKPQPTAAGAPDPLGRETPHGTVMGFLRAAQDENYSLAAQYFQPLPGHRRRNPAEEQDLAAQLLAIINQKIRTSSLDALSNEPQGRLDDGLPPNQEVLTGVQEATGTFSIELLRLDDEHGNKIWSISRKTLDTVPETYDSLQFSDIERKLPPYIAKKRFLSVPLWQWIAIIVAVPLAVIAAWILSLLPRLAIRYYRRRFDPAAVPAKRLVHVGPGTLLLAALIHYGFVFYIGTSIVYRQYYRRVIWIFLASAFYWMVVRATREVSERIGIRLTISGRMAERSIVSLARRAFEVFVLIVVILIVLSGFGVNVTAALAGLGIGGLAIGLGAQKTFENLLGGIAILTDKALIIGDPCRIGDQRGTVEDIGLRSIKLRTEDRTVVTIPNGTVATAVLENYRQRDKILFRQMVRLRYDLSSDHFRYLLDEVRTVLKQNNRVESATSRVRLIRFADYSIDLEVYAYILVRDYAEYLELQEELILSIVETIEKTGVAIALPSQGAFVPDSWIDPEKVKAARAKLEKAREPGASGT
ncbi:MAG TPA: mechanosensitive ion channel domain-containing protein [Candidatus Acidoferrum sp.]